MRGKHALSKTVAVLTAAAAMAGLGLPASPASAAESRNSGWSHGGGPGVCGYDGVGHGRFEHKGDWFVVTLSCRQAGHAVLLADYTGSEAEDLVIWDTTPYSDDYKKKQVNLPEGRKVEIRVCEGDKTDQAYWDCGAWRTGYA